MADFSKFNRLREKPLVLLSALDWGLGHTTRCIPLIRELIRLQCEVIVAGTSAQKALLEIEFQALTFYEAPTSPILYGKNRVLTLIRLLVQVPKILTGIKRENRWLNAFLKEHPVDAIISDNRFGLFAPGIPCIFITHQLHIKTGLGAWADAQAQRTNYRFIKNFTACWVPDFEKTHSLAGELSNPPVQPKISVTRIGVLSRFERCDNISGRHLLIILSGPEPQRSLLEKKMIADLNQYQGEVVLVRGLPNNDVQPQVPAYVKVYNHVPAAQLNQLICHASMVISRCGYTTVMDLVKLQKKSILIPTPGQAEQEYLAKYLQEKKFAYTVTQNNFSLSSALQAAGQFAFQQMDVDMEEYKLHLQRLVAAIA